MTIAIRSRWIGFACAVVLVSLSGVSQAADGDKPDYEMGLYVWGAMVAGDLETSKGESSMHIPFSDVWDNLNLAVMAHGRAIFSDTVDPNVVGAQLASRAVRAVTRAMTVRDHAASHAFHDVAYADLIADPMKEIRRIYDFLALPLAPATEASMQRWLAANPQNKRGVHRYRLEDFGLDRKQLVRRFEP